MPRARSAAAKIFFRHRYFDTEWQLVRSLSNVGCLLLVIPHSLKTLFRNLGSYQASVWLWECIDFDCRKRRSKAVKAQRSVYTGCKAKEWRYDLWDMNFHYLISEAVRRSHSQLCQLQPIKRGLCGGLQFSNMSSCTYALHWDHLGC